MKKKKSLSPFIKIIFSFLAVILIGTLVLLLPWVTHDDNLTFIEALFTSTSAVCVTGLSVTADIGSTFTVFGKIVLAALIEIGGLGFITITMFVLIIFKVKIGIKDRFLIKEIFSQEKSGGLVKMVKNSILTALIIQLIGSIVNILILYFTMNFTALDAIGVGIFHTISSFNNAGFDLFGSTSLAVYSSNSLLLISTSLLIILGGIGFIVIYDLLNFHKLKKISLHSKIVLFTSLLLLLIGTVSFKFLMNLDWVNAFFMSTSSRTAGFSTIGISNFKNSPAFIILIILMFIGASPCSTGGGIKTTTFFVLMKTIFSYSFGKSTVILNRKIADSSIFKAFSLTIIAICFIILVIVTIGIIEQNFNATANIYMNDIIFESFSAFSTTGLSTGITPNFHWVNKLILCITMFMGRLGPLTFFNIWAKQRFSDNNSDVRYVEKQIIIG